MFFQHKSQICPLLKSLIALAVFLTPALIAGCAKEPAKTEKTEKTVLATANGEEILQETLDRELHRIDKDFSVKAEDSRMAQLAKEILRQMIRRRLLLQDAATKGIRLSPEEASKAIEDQREGMSRKELEATLENTGITYEAWEKRILDNELIEMLIQQVIDPKIEITDNELLNYYEEHRLEFQMPVRVKVRQIVVAKEEEAGQVRKRLYIGQEAFEQVAAEVSLSPDSAQGGDIGVFAPGQMPPEFDEVCFSLEIGEISQVVESDYGFHIFRVDDRFPEGEIPFQEARDKIFNKLFSERREKAFLDYQEDLWNRSEIVLLLDGG
jgi:parvulin-like peptidyl-prolyl isomerase